MVRWALFHYEMALTNLNVPPSGVPYFTPAQHPPSGTALNPQPDGKPIPTLFQPFKIRGQEFHNRIFLSPLCQYSAENGKTTLWHKAHLGGIFTRGPGLSMMEATAVTPQGRITPEDLGLWSDEHLAPLAEVVEFAHSQGQKIGIQISHSGRKGSTTAPWLEGDLVASSKVGGWPDDVWAPSAISYDDAHAKPKALTKEGIDSVIKAFAMSAQRAVKAGFDVIEIHNAHGYLLQSFLSPFSNKRDDDYGGSFENRIRLTLEIVDAVRAVIPETMPLFLRISATDWLEESMPNEPSWRIEDTVRLAPILHAHGIDFLDVVTGGNNPNEKIKGGIAYQVPFAHEVKKALDPTSKLVVGCVGVILDGKTSQAILDNGQADVVSVGRNFIKNPSTVWAFAEDLGVQVHLAKQIGWGFKGKGRKHAPSRASLAEISRGCRKLGSLSEGPLRRAET
ncbi:hypothetical protein H0H87_012882 [Tephrocybe sp. NHM501043]|nr:hypothetical protein H0H87_012882 [Tephrocybe sp. NHM501043]